jgi:hypothetical protein
MPLKPDSAPEPEVNDNSSVVDDTPDELSQVEAEFGDKGKSAGTDQDASANPDVAKESKTEISAELLERAEQLGLDADDLKAIGDPKRAERIVEAFESRKAEATEAPAKKEFTVQRANLKLDPDVFDKELSDAIGKLDEHYAGQLEGVLAKFNDFVGKQEDNVREARLDGFFKDIESQYKDVFGKPRNRQTVKTAMEVLEAGYKAKGRKVPSERELFDMAVNSSFAEHRDKAVRKDVSEQLRRKTSQHIARPNSNDPKTSNGVTRAVEAVAQRMHDLDFSDDTED